MPDGVETWLDVLRVGKILGKSFREGFHRVFTHHRIESFKVRCFSDAAEKKIRIRSARMKRLFR